MKKLIQKITFLTLCVASIFSATLSVAQTQMKVVLITGGDDLRAGNNSFITVNYSNGTTSPEYRLGGGFANNSSNTKNVTLNRMISSMADISSIVIRHDGSPRAGQPFDTYDNWNLQTLRVTFVIGGTDNTCINETGNPLARFTGSLRNRSYIPKCGGGSNPTGSSKVKAYITTGSDDLRTGNNAYMTIVYTDGTTSAEFNLGGGFTQNSLNTKPFDIGKVVTDLSTIKSITIRHNGSPRAGQPFDTYDNWDLQSLRVVLVMPDGVEKNIINTNGNPLARFTGQLRTKTWNR
jgi:hypothetical protein